MTKIMDQSRWIKTVSVGGNIRGVAIQSTSICQEIADAHGLKGSDAKGLAEAVLGGVLLASYCKGEERVNLNIRGSGVYAQALVDAYPNGSVRGMITTRPESEAFQGETSGPWGEGLLSVLRSKSSEDGQPYIGTVPIVTGHLAKDLTFYWYQSEQIPSAVGIVVELDQDRIKSAGAFLVQIMPGATEEEILAVEQNVIHLQNMTQKFLNNESPIKILSEIFQNSAFTILEEKPLKFECHCSRERVERSLLLLGPEELKNIKDPDQPTAKVTCDFCSEDYHFNDSEIQSLIHRLNQ